MELEFEKYCTLVRSPRTFLQPPRNSSKFENKVAKENPSSRNDPFCLEEGFSEIKFRNYRSVSCKSLPSKKVEVEGKELLKRGSVYESSKERKLKGSEFVEGRKKIEFSLSGDCPFSFNILDSICGSDEEDPLEEKRSSVVTSPCSNTSYSAKSSKLSSRDCLDPLLHVPEDRSVNFDARENSSSKYGERDPMENHKFKCDQVIAPSNNANILRERDNLALTKSLSAKLTLPHSPTHTESEFTKGSLKPRFSPFRRMFDPLTKSKSHRSPLSSNMDHNEVRSSGGTSIGRNGKMLRKSLLQDFSSTTQNLESGCQSMKQQQQQTVVSQCSPAYLHGSLKLEQKHGVPYFEFSLAHPEDVFVAKTWKAEDAHNWVYTFHCVQGGKNRNASGWGLRCSRKDSPMVGQMQVSCYLHSELKDGEFSDSMVTEFVLYDISHARKSVATKEESGFSDVAKVQNPAKEAMARGTIELDDLFNPHKLKSPVTSSINHDNSDFSAPYPWTPTDLHPSLEIAAVVVQVPFHRRESLKCRRGDTIDDRIHSNLLDFSLVEPIKMGISGDVSTVKVNVVTPFGHHGLPTTESKGPSPLLDRWRLGGGCDCGGWDMACPLVVFGNHNAQSEQQHSLLDSEQPFELYVEGAKEKTPALSIAVTEKGHYSVDFHAQLSSLQAFAICVATLHTTETSTSIEQEKNKHLLQSSSLKVLVEDEVKVLIEAVTAEERRKVRKAAGANPAPFMPNPPFSPIARV
ncbi:hypothetical protein Ancab_032669 [Ancistrocladus abbreviatus]